MNYLHVDNTPPDFWVGIAQTYLEVRVAQNWKNTIKIRERGGKNHAFQSGAYKRPRAGCPYKT